MIGGEVMICLMNSDDRCWVVQYQHKSQLYNSMRYFKHCGRSCRDYDIRRTKKKSQTVRLKTECNGGVIKE